MEKQYHPLSLFFVILGILACCVADGFLTYTLLAKGIIQELNPIMKYFLELGLAPFLGIKYVITAGGVIILTSLRKRIIFHGKLKIGDFLPFIEFLYILLLIYEASVLSQLSR